MVQRTGSEGKGKLTFVQNNFYYDAFFLKALGEYTQLKYMLRSSQLRYR